MAPAIVHFLVGATLLLVLAILVGLRSPLPVWGPLWLVAIGGLWGLGPDFHHFEPLVGGPVHALYDAPWADCWALHYTLDRPLVRANTIRRASPARSPAFSAPSARSRWPSGWGPGRLGPPRSSTGWQAPSRGSWSWAS
ncbi:hypothetical protein [Natrinema sp. 1APR25-10V2]|uniref:hypothetical protein n=1 Tax=Natrinema sp. 1APR25-10V2 TaxID=2951081 RepID=UPI002876F858|nr:hypothetical protein [Natrinema sp. 1APR25-10V2]MDS0475659.1 hypothetical protein [Natrinema sp. 1APR25-10V2]